MSRCMFSSQKCVVRWRERSRKKKMTAEMTTQGWSRNVARREALSAESSKLFRSESWLGHIQRLRSTNKKRPRLTCGSRWTRAHAWGIMTIVSRGVEAPGVKLSMVEASFLHQGDRKRVRQSVGHHVTRTVLIGQGSVARHVWRPQRVQNDVLHCLLKQDISFCDAGTARTELGYSFHRVQKLWSSESLRAYLQLSRAVCWGSRPTSAFNHWSFGPSRRRRGKWRVVASKSFLFSPRAVSSLVPSRLTRFWSPVA